MNQTIINEEFEYDFEYYKVEALIKFYFESNYGADVDGNRGVSRCFIEEVVILSILDEEDNIIYIPDGKKLEDLESDVRIKIDFFIDEISDKFLLGTIH